MKLAFGRGTVANSSWVEELAKKYHFEYVEIETDTVEQIVSGTEGCDAIVVALHKLTAEKIRNFPSSIRAISRLGVGLDSIDLVAAAELKMPVIFQPTYAFNEVANHALAMIMSLARGLPQGDASTKKGEWTPAPKIARITSLQDTTLGVVGCGRIGRSLIEKARPIFKNIVGFDPAVTDQIPGCTMASSLDELLKQSEIITMHAPYLHAVSFTLSYGVKQSVIQLHETPHGFVIERDNQRGVNIDRTEVIYKPGSNFWIWTDIPYPKQAGGNFFRILSHITPIDRERTYFWVFRWQKSSGWRRNLWRFLYKNRLEKRHLDVLEQDRVMMVGIPADVREREMLIYVPDGEQPAPIPCTVLDPFLGSGTTAVAAILEGFDWIGCELTDDYLPIIHARTEWAAQNRPQPDLTLFGEPE